ncbi:unnamed protein product [marine sediment metagenome]|uniref:Uncharacterized protein n=1 Tax=marine sediment metagenome TaxID=412755 RepID=X0VII3_9ZZZZ
MPNGFWYAGGDTHVFESAKPVSAFSKGDLLTLSTSSLSRIATTYASGSDIVGVATSDSIDSIDGLCSYIVPGPDTLFWASAASGIGTAMIPGAEGDVLFDVAEGRYHVDLSSTNSVRAVVMRGSAGVGSVSQSVQSKVLCKLIYHAGNLDLS